MLKPTTLLAGVAAIVLSVGAVFATTASAAQYEGTVVAKNAKKRTFSVMQDEGGGTFTFKVTNATKFQRIAGFAAIKTGLKNIEVVARRADNGALIATQVERSGKDGGGGGNDDGPNDDD